MRRSTVLPLLALAMLVLAGAFYAGTWYYLAGRVGDAVETWRAARRAEGFTVAWDRYVVGGFPFVLRVTIEQPVFGQTGAEPGYEVRGAVLVGEARPWALRHWHIAADAGARLTVQPGPARPAVTIDAASIDGTWAPREDADATKNTGTEIDLTADQLAIAAEQRFTIAHAAAHALMPSRPVASHLETWLAATLSIERLTLPVTAPPLGDVIDRIAATLAVKGAIPQGPRRQALAAWRDDGGTLEVEVPGLDWGKLAVTANGTLALDAAMQPIGALTATIRGYGEIIDALATAGALKQGDAALAKLGLGMLAKPGADGKSQITAPLTLQNGFLFIGPARLARVPKIAWE